MVSLSYHLPRKEDDLHGTGAVLRDALDTPALVIGNRRIIDDPGTVATMWHSFQQVHVEALKCFTFGKVNGP